MLLPDYPFDHSVEEKKFHPMAREEKKKGKRIWKLMIEKRKAFSREGRGEKNHYQNLYHMVKMKN